MPLDWKHDVEPVLEATYRLLHESPHPEIDGDAIAVALGREDHRSVFSGFRIAAREGWVDVADWLPGEPVPRGITPTEKGLRHFMGWPA